MRQIGQYSNAYKLIHSFIHSFHFISGPYDTIRYDTIEEFNVAHKQQKKTKKTQRQTHTQTQIKLMKYENC